VSEPVAVSASTTKPINMGQLIDALKSAGTVKVDGGNIENPGPKTVTVWDLDQATLEARLAAYTHDPMWGAPPERAAIGALAAKAQQVVAGTANFTPAELQRAIAAVVVHLHQS
jgi:hypothetical protein